MGHQKARLVRRPRRPVALDDARSQLQRNHCLLAAGAVQGAQHGNWDPLRWCRSPSRAAPGGGAARDGDRRPVHIKLLQLKRQHCTLSGREQLVQLALKALKVLLRRCALG